MLSFSVVDNDHGRQIIVHADKDGMTNLIDALQTLKDNDDGHIHLRSSFAGGSDLSKETPLGKRAIDDVMINYI